MNSLVKIDENFLNGLTTNIETLQDKDVTSILKFDWVNGLYSLGKDGVSVPNRTYVILNPYTWEKGFICFADELDGPLVVKRPIHESPLTFKDADAEHDITALTNGTNNRGQPLPAEWQPQTTIEGQIFLDGEPVPFKYSPTSGGGRTDLDALQRQFTRHLMDGGQDRPYIWCSLRTSKYHNKKVRAERFNPRVFLEGFLPSGELPRHEQVVFQEADDTLPVVEGGGAMASSSEQELLDVETITPKPVRRRRKTE